MIKRIKRYFYLRRIQKEMQVEVLETLATICLYLGIEGGRYSHNPKAALMKSHFIGLKHYSDILKKEIESERKKCEQWQRIITKNSNGTITSTSARNM